MSLERVMQWIGSTEDPVSNDYLDFYLGGERHSQPLYIDIPGAESGHGDYAGSIRAATPRRRLAKEFLWLD